LATLACDNPRKSRLRVQPDQQNKCAKTVFLKRISVQKSPKGAAGLAQVCKTEVFLQRLSVQKSPKGAAGLAQQVRKIEVSLKKTTRAKTDYRCSRIDIINALEQVHNSPTGTAGSAKAHSLSYKL
jgi:hypothetical protein